MTPQPPTTADWLSVLLKPWHQTGCPFSQNYGKCFNADCSNKRERLEQAIHSHVQQVEASYKAEVWKTITGFPNYSVSSAGRIKSVPRLRTRGGMLKPVLQPTGYLAVTLMNEGVPQNALIHRLVAHAFLPNPLGYYSVNHIDGNKQNNYITNLEWNSLEDNVKHAYENGLNNQTGSHNSQSKLTEDDVALIRNSHQRNHLLAIRYGVSASLIGKVKKGVGWSHVTQLTTPKQPKLKGED